MTSTPGNAVGERRNRGLVRAVADPDEERPLVEPDRVAALGEHGLVELDRRPERRRSASEARSPPARLAVSSLPGRRSTAPSRADEHGVVNVDRVRDCPGRGRETTTSAPAASSSPQRLSCSAAAAAWSGAARQPYSRQRSASSASGGRTSTRSSVPVIGLRAEARHRGTLHRVRRRCAPRAAPRAAPNASIPIASRASRVALAMCGVRTTFSIASSSSLTPARARRRRAPRRRSSPAWSAATSAASSTTGPRAVLTRTAVGFIAASASASTRWCVSGVSGQWRLTTSAAASRGGGRRRAPRSVGSRAVRLGELRDAAADPPGPTTRTSFPSRPSPTMKSGPHSQ